VLAVLFTLIIIEIIFLLLYKIENKNHAVSIDKNSVNWDINICPHCIRYYGTRICISTKRSNVDS